MTKEVIKMRKCNSSLISLSIQKNKHVLVGTEGLFAEKFIELCQDTFVQIYRKVSESYWNNSIYGNVRRPYYMCDHDFGVAEYYVPTVLNGEGFIQCHRIVVSVLPELDDNIYESEIYRLTRPLSPPMGIIDSTTIFVVAPKVTRRHAFRVWKEKFKAMLKIKRVAGCFTIPIISSDPEIAFKKLLAHLTNFWNKRINAFLNRLKVQAWQYDYNIKNLLSNTYRVIENCDRQIIHCLRSMIAHFLYFAEGFTKILKSIGKLSEIKAQIMEIAQNLTDLIHFLEPKEREHVLISLSKYSSSLVVRNT
jgi:hypothetical protein